MPSRRFEADQRALRALVQRLLRGFGALAADQTPCGQPLPIAYAHALMVLSAGEGLGQQELVAELGLDKSNVARLCARMTARGHLEQHPVADDGRRRRLVLTPRGQRLAREVTRSSEARFAALLGAIPSASRQPVLTALAELASAVSTLPPAAATTTPTATRGSDVARPPAAPARSPARSAGQRRVPARRRRPSRRPR